MPIDSDTYKSFKIKLLNDKIFQGTASYWMPIMLMCFFIWLKTQFFWLSNFYLFLILKKKRILSGMELASVPMEMWKNQHISAHHALLCHLC